nr:putative reverse transcriptase domain-containing protein [Tanacetum cinerariifolium]
MHKAFPLLGESFHWQYKFPLSVEGVPTARRMEIPLPRVCTAMMKKLPSSLIPLSRGSFDVILGMDWLSKRKFMIVCHEKVVWIPLEGDEILRVHGERTQGVVKNLMNTKVDEPRISDIPVVREFTDVFPKDLSALPSQRQVEFRIDLVPEATLVAKSPYRLAPSEMQELKKRLKSRRVRGMILVAQSEAFKQENVLAERLHSLDQQMERKRDESLYFMDRIWVLLVGSVMDEAHASRYLVHLGADKTYYNLEDIKEWNSIDNQLRLRWMIYLMVLADDAESTLEDIMRACVIDFGGSYHLNIRCAPFEALYGRKCRLHVLWAEIGEGSLIRPELVLEMTDKVAFPLPGESSHWQYKFPLPVKVVPTARRLEMPLLGVCTAIEEMMKKLPVKDRWQLH